MTAEGTTGTKMFGFENLSDKAFSLNDNGDIVFDRKIDMFEKMKEKYPRWMFISVVGSQNYGTAIEGSDTDVKLAYLPTFEEFYRNKFVHSDTGSPDGDDYTVHPAHEFLGSVLR